MVWKSFPSTSGEEACGARPSHTHEATRPSTGDQLTCGSDVLETGRGGDGQGVAVDPGTLESRSVHTTERWSGSRARNSPADKTFKNDPDHAAVIVDLETPPTVLAATRAHFLAHARWIDTCHKHPSHLAVGNACRPTCCDPCSLSLAIHPDHFPVIA